MKIAILTSPNQWFVPYAKILNNKIISSELYFNHENIIKSYDIVFILSYHKIISKEYLKKNKHNIVIHASALPKGKGWAPMFWQILEGNNDIPFSMFEADSGIDSGKIYMQRVLKLTGYELNNELRDKQANFTINMCLEFIKNYHIYQNPKAQYGVESVYSKRNIEDSKLDINKTIKEQFNLLRIVDNKNYPAFFELDGHRYILKIELEKKGGGVELIDFLDMTLAEKEMVLSWRNNENIKRWMYSQDDIKLEDHLSYIDSLEVLIDKQYLTVKKNDRYIGVIDFTNIDFENKITDFGLYSNPFEKVAGVGRILEEICIKYAFELLKLDTLKLEVFDENIQVKNLHKKYNFQETGYKIVNGKNVICMELKRKGKI